MRALCPSWLCKRCRDVCGAAGITMCCVAGAAGGRIFMGGLDGHLHELCYANAASMFSRRCYQVSVLCCTQLCSC